MLVKTNNKTSKKKTIENSRKPKETIRNNREQQRTTKQKLTTENEQLKVVKANKQYQQITKISIGHKKHVATINNKYHKLANKNIRSNRD